MNIKEMIDIEKKLMDRVVAESMNIRQTINNKTTRKIKKSEQKTEKLPSIVIRNESLAS